jgi:hypothetical protein
MTLNESFNLYALERQQSPSCTTARDRFLAEVMKSARKIVWHKCREYAEDIAQQVALIVWQRIDKFNPELSPIGYWVWCKTMDVLNEHLAANYQSNELHFNEDFPMDEIGSDDVLRDRSADHFTRLREYFGDDQELLNLLLAGHSFKECEGVLGLSREAVRYRVNKVKRRAYRVK